MPRARPRSPSPSTPGPIARMGPVRFSGTEKVNTTYLQRRVPFKEGELYDPAKVDALRGRLTSLGVFNAVRIRPATTLDANGELPIDVELTDRPAALHRLRHQLRDAARLRRERLLGASQSVRRGREPAGSRPRSTISARGRRSPTPASPSAPTSASPTGGCPARTARATAEALREVLPAYNRNAVALFGGIDRIISPVWQVRVGLTAEASQVDAHQHAASGRTIGCSACRCRC